MTIQNQWHAKIWANNNDLLLQSMATPEDDDQLDDATGGGGGGGTDDTDDTAADEKEICGNDEDEDLDGLADGDDPDCAGEDANEKS